MYIYKINVLVKSSENLSLENFLDNLIKTNILQSEGELVSVQTNDISDSIYGKCSKCGIWTSEQNTKYSVSEFTPGRQINGCWYCDLCVSELDPLHF